ncbi:MAG: tetratricopeptide repeat protein [Candidatus Kaistia colombiensis]|nr:MAG: tetratricopeptide repeat protein [Kaistia sp.]
MRAFVISLFAFVALSSVSLAATPGAGDSASKNDGLADQSLDQLFTSLAKPGDETAGSAIEAELERRWRDSGSDTIDLLMQWATEAIATKNFPRAFDYLDAVTTMRPDYVEGWNRRATLFFLQNDYGKALSDLDKVLALEPRHFGALAGLGMILNEIDRKKEALLALKKAIAIDPYLDDQVRDAIKTLEPQIDGREI